VGRWHDRRRLTRVGTLRALATFKTFETLKT
jgi:hypothetical protein